MDTIKKILKLCLAGIVMFIPVGVFIALDAIQSSRKKKSIDDKVTVQENVIAILQKGQERNIINAQ